MKRLKARLAVLLMWCGVTAASVLLFADERHEIAIVRDLLIETVPPETYAERIDKALAAGDMALAESYAETASLAGSVLPPATIARMEEARGFLVTGLRVTRDFAEGFVTGEANSVSSLSGALVSDLTVIGDIRDIAREGPAFVAGEPHDELMLGLSVAGVGLTAASVASGGTALPAKVGASVAKAALRTGRITARFSGELRLLAARAIDMPALRQALARTSFHDLQALRRIAARHADKLRGSRLARVFDDAATLVDHAGPSQALRLMERVGSADELTDLAAMSRVLGKRTLAVAELTGRITLRGLKRGWPLARVLASTLYVVLASIPLWIAWRILRLFVYRAMMSHGSAGARRGLLWLGHGGARMASSDGV